MVTAKLIVGVEELWNAGSWIPAYAGMTGQDDGCLGSRLKKRKRSRFLFNHEGHEVIEGIHFFG